MKYNSVKNPKWANADSTAINCEVDFADLDEAFSPFTASADDSYPHCVEIFNRCVAGDFGPVSPYKPLTFSDEVVAGWIRADRDAALAASDWTQFPDAQLTEEKRAAWVAYRQALRSIPDQQGFPREVLWPEKP